MAALRDAIEKALGARVELQGAGRTDAGVHALGQVLHVRAAVKRAFPTSALLGTINDALGHDIAVLSVEEVPDNFHARHDAESRCYLYRISLRKNAFAKRHVWWIKEQLDTGSMREAAAMLPGRHDFSAFQANDPSRPNESPIVVVESVHLDAVGKELHFRITASHFLWRMVRRIVGALAKVGLGEFAVEDFAAALGGDIRYQEAIARWTAPAAGLYLESVRYRPASRVETKNRGRATPPRETFSARNKGPAMGRRAQSQSAKPNAGKSISHPPRTGRRNPPDRHPAQDR